jgi:hypothetical protein
MKQQHLTITDIVPCVIIAMMFPALELWIIFVIDGSVLASLVYWFIYGLAVYGSSFGLWYWLTIANQESRKTGSSRVATAGNDKKVRGE